MKFIVFIGITIVVLGAAWTVYLDYSNTRFVKSLPQAPIRENLDETQGTSLTKGPFEKQNVTETVEGLPTDSDDMDLQGSPASDPIMEPQGSPASDPIEVPETGGAENFQENLPEMQPPPKSTSQPKINIFEMSPEELRRFYVEKHGDSPEIHTVVDYFHRFVEGEVLTGDEMLKFLGAVKTVFPSENTQKVYEKIEKREQATAERNKALKNVPHQAQDGVDEKEEP